MSDRVSRGEAEDGSGDLLEELLRQDGFEVERRLVPDERAEISAALRVLAGANRAGTRIDVDVAWPQPRKEAYRSWQPKEPSPIVAKLLGHR